MSRRGGIRTRTNCIMRVVGGVGRKRCVSPRMLSEKANLTMVLAKRMAETGNANNVVWSCCDTRSARRLAEVSSVFLNGV